MDEERIESEKYQWKGKTIDTNNYIIDICFRPNGKGMW